MKVDLIILLETYKYINHSCLEILVSVLFNILFRIKKKKTKRKCVGSNLHLTHVMISKRWLVKNIKICFLLQTRQSHNCKFCIRGHFVCLERSFLEVACPKSLDRLDRSWLTRWSSIEVIFGLPFQIIVLDLVTKQMVQIPSLKSSEDSIPAECPCGIHSIAVNPSKSLLATGGQNTNDLGIYRLPTFDPVCIGEVRG